MHPEDDTTCQQGVYQEIASLGEILLHCWSQDCAMPRHGVKRRRRSYVWLKALHLVGALPAEGPSLYKSVNKFCAGGKVGDHATGNCGLGQRPRSTHSEGESLGIVGAISHLGSAGLCPAAPLPRCE